MLILAVRRCYDPRRGDRTRVHSRVCRQRALYVPCVLPFLGRILEMDPLFVSAASAMDNVSFPLRILRIFRSRDTYVRRRMCLGSWPQLCRLAPRELSVLHADFAHADRVVYRNARLSGLSFLERASGSAYLPALSDGSRTAFSSVLSVFQDRRTFAFDQGPSDRFSCFPSIKIKGVLHRERTAKEKEKI